MMIKHPKEIDCPRCKCRGILTGTTSTYQRIRHVREDGSVYWCINGIAKEVAAK